MTDKMKDIMGELEKLSDLSKNMGDYSDPIADLDVSEFEASFGGMSQLGIPSFDRMDDDGPVEMNGRMFTTGLESLEGYDDAELFGDGMNPMAGIMKMPGAPTEIGLYDTVIVHGLQGDYQLTFDETEDGLVISVLE